MHKEHSTTKLNKIKKQIVLSILVILPWRKNTSTVKYILVIHGNGIIKYILIYTKLYISLCRAYVSLDIQ